MVLKETQEIKLSRENVTFNKDVCSWTGFSKNNITTARDLLFLFVLLFFFVVVFVFSPIFPAHLSSRHTPPYYPSGEVMFSFSCSNQQHAFNLYRHVVHVQFMVISSKCFTLKKSLTLVGIFLVYYTYF